VPGAPESGLFHPRRSLPAAPDRSWQGVLQGEWQGEDQVPTEIGSRSSVILTASMFDRSRMPDDKPEILPAHGTATK